VLVEIGFVLVFIFFVLFLIINALRRGGAVVGEENRFCW
jgi:hypothetical protein